MVGLISDSGRLNKKHPILLAKKRGIFVLINQYPLVAQRLVQRSYKPSVTGPTPIPRTDQNSCLQRCPGHSFFCENIKALVYFLEELPGGTRTDLLPNGDRITSVINIYFNGFENYSRNFALCGASAAEDGG